MRGTAGATEAFGADNDGVAIWTPASRLLAGTFRCGPLLGMKIELDVAQVLLDIAHNIAKRKGVPAFSEELHQVLREVTGGKTKDGRGNV